MEILKFFLHLDVYMAQIIDLFGTFTYVILFLVIFVETGLVVMPFLPGDSLLFIVGTLAGSNFLNIIILYPILFSAAIIGDNVNYWIGHHLGAKVFSKENSRFFSKKYLEKTREFYIKHGVKTIILARFVPIVRTFAPFVAGIGRMHYKTFLSYDILGGFLWTALLTFAGFFFGGLPIVKKNFEIAVFGIIFISLLPMLFEYLKHKRAAKALEKEKEQTSYKEIEEVFKKEHLSD